MSFANALVRQQQAIFGRLGENASWDGVAGTVRIVRRTADQEVKLGIGVVVETGITIRVRKSEVPAPAEGQQVQALDDSGDPLLEGLFVITGTPEIDRKGVWHCTAQAAA